MWTSGSSGSVYCLLCAFWVFWWEGRGSMPGGLGVKRKWGGALDRTPSVSLSLGAGSARCREGHMFPSRFGYSSLSFGLILLDLVNYYSSSGHCRCISSVGPIYWLSALYPLPKCGLWWLLVLLCHGLRSRGNFHDKVVHFFQSCVQGGAQRSHLSPPPENPIFCEPAGEYPKQTSDGPICRYVTGEICLQGAWEELQLKLTLSRPQCFSCRMSFFQGCRLISHGKPPLERVYVPYYLWSKWVVERAKGGASETPVSASPTEKWNCSTTLPSNQAWWSNYFVLILCLQSLTEVCSPLTWTVMKLNIKIKYNKFILLFNGVTCLEFPSKMSLCLLLQHHTGWQIEMLPLTSLMMLLLLLQRLDSLAQCARSWFAHRGLR